MVSLTNIFEQVRKLESTNQLQKAIELCIIKGSDFYGGLTHHECFKLFKYALELSENLKDDFRKGMILNRMGTTNLYLGEYDKAYKYYKQSLEIFKSINNIRKIGVLYNNIGQVFGRTGDLDRALEYFKKSLEIDQQIENKAGEAVCLNNIGHILEQRGDYDKALQYYGKALEIDENLGNSELIALRLNNIGSIYKKRGYLDEALKYFKKALIINEKIGSLGGKSLNFNNIGVILQRQGKYHEGLKYIKQGLEIERKAGDMIAVSYRLNNIGLIYQHLGQHDKAIKYIKQALKISDQIGHKTGKATHLHNIGFSLAHKGNLNEALEYYKQALDLIQKQIKGKEIDYKSGKITCPNVKCNTELEIRMLGNKGAIVETCHNCQTQFSIWMVDQKSSRYQVRIISEGVLGVEEGDVKLSHKTGREIKTKISEWLEDGADFTSNIGNLYKKMKKFDKACSYYYQSASMYRGLGRINESNEMLRKIENIIVNLDNLTKNHLLHEISRLRNQTSEMIRSRDFIYIYISCPNCNRENQIRASQTTIAIEICKNCGTKYSVYYDDMIQEFYTNILEKSKIITPSIKERIKKDIVKFCVRCGLKVGILSLYCARCGHKILRS
jgi:tetratricopeptide (TPR) repeat protein